MLPAHKTGPTFDHTLFRVATVRERSGKNRLFKVWESWEIVYQVRKNSSHTSLKSWGILLLACHLDICERVCLLVEVMWLQTISNNFVAFLATCGLQKVRKTTGSVLYPIKWKLIITVISVFSPKINQHICSFPWKGGLLSGLSAWLVQVIITWWQEVDSKLAHLNSWNMIPLVSAWNSIQFHFKNLLDRGASASWDLAESNLVGWGTLYTVYLNQGHLQTPMLLIHFWKSVDKKTKAWKWRSFLFSVYFPFSRMDLCTEIWSSYFAMCNAYTHKATVSHRNFQLKLICNSTVKHVSAGVA